jgi:hypothetical protein
VLCPLVQTHSSAILLKRLLHSRQTWYEVPNVRSEAAWNGTGLSKGGCVELETAIKETTELIDTYIKQSLPDGKYKDLCLKLNSSSSKWLSNLVTYLNGEIKRVQKYGIPEQKTYTLVLDQLHTMYEEMWSSCWLM